MLNNLITMQFWPAESLWCTRWTKQNRSKSPESLSCQAIDQLTFSNYTSNSPGTESQNGYRAEGRHGAHQPQIIWLNNSQQQLNIQSKFTQSTIIKKHLKASTNQYYALPDAFPLHANAALGVAVQSRDSMDNSFSTEVVIASDSNFDRTTQL